MLKVGRYQPQKIQSSHLKSLMRLREQSLPQDAVEWPRGVICDLTVDTRVDTANRTVYCKAEYELELTDQTVMRSRRKRDKPT